MKRMTHNGCGVTQMLSTQYRSCRRDSSVLWSLQRLHSCLIPQSITQCLLVELTQPPRTPHPLGNVHPHFPTTQSLLCPFFHFEQEVGWGFFARNPHEMQCRLTLKLMGPSADSPCYPWSPVPRALSKLLLPLINAG